MKPLMNKEDILAIIGQNVYDRHFRRGHETLMGIRKPDKEIDITKLRKTKEASIQGLLMELGAAVLLRDVEEEKSVKFRIATEYAFLEGLHHEKYS